MASTTPIRIRISPHWCLVRDADPQGRILYERHYSCRRYRDGRVRTCFVGPGEKLVLLTAAGDALLAWRRFLSRNDQEGIYCSVFHNESRHMSSVLIAGAMQVAWCRWPGERLYTYVNPGAVRSSNPGFCFLQAGWRKCGQTPRGLLILEVRP